MNGSFLFVIAAMFLIMWLLLIRPQRQQQRRHTAMVEALKPGDEVITAGGLYGDVAEVQEDRVTLEIAEDVQVEVAKRAISTIVPAVEHAREPEPLVEEDVAQEDDVREEDAARR